MKKLLNTLTQHALISKAIAIVLLLLLSGGLLYAPELMVQLLRYSLVILNLAVVVGIVVSFIRNRQRR